MSSPFQEIVSGYLEKLRQECQEKQWHIMHDRRPVVAQELHAEIPEIQIAFLKTVLRHASELAPGPGAQVPVLTRVFSGFLGTAPTYRRLNWLEFRTLGNIVCSLVRQKIPFPAKDLAEIIRSYADNIQQIHYCFPLASFLSTAEAGARTPETEAAVQALKQAFTHVLRHSNSKENRKLLERINRYLKPDAEPQFIAGGPWSSAVLAEIENCPESDRRRWSGLFIHCLAAQSSTPSKAWRKRAEELISAIGADKVRASALRWLDPNVTPIAPGGTHMADQDADYIKGFIWILAGFADGEVCQAVAECGLACLRKIPNIGPVSARVGFACVNVLAEMPGMQAVSQLTRMRAKVKYAVALKLVDRALNAAAERVGIGRDDLEDIAVPGYDLDSEGRRFEELGDCSVEMVLIAPTFDKADLRWKNAAGKLLKAVPTEVKQNYPTRLKEIKREAADLQKMLAAQRLRLEQFLMNERKIGYEQWCQYLLHHPLMSAITRRLIWRFDTGGQQAVGIWLNGVIVNWNNEPVTGLGHETTVQLWHPLQSDPQTILSWRCWLEDHRVVQPFKQAHREVYILTPAEEQTETYSNRFAAHVIRQHQFASLCRERGWQYRLMGAGFDGHNVPTLEVARRSIKAEFWVEIPQEDVGDDPLQGTNMTSGSGINLCLLTDQVRFYRDGMQARLGEVPPVVFSEIMRDVDLFVGVTSIGNDPTWVDRGETPYGQYWNTFAFGELRQSGEIRRAILERLLPQLKISSRCMLEGKFLVVRGDLHTYKIHLGSANVLVEPGSRYLCIVPDRGSRNGKDGPLYLPFDGDNTLAVILSKAFLLAADKNITDATILRQLKHPGVPVHLIP